MMLASKAFRRLARDATGTMVIETAIIAPVLVLLSLGAYQVSNLVARQSELQSAMGMAEAVALASSIDTDDERTTLKNIIATSAGLEANQIAVVERFRCNSSADLVIATSYCTVGDKVSRYVDVTLVDTYEPIWAEFGVGSDINLNVGRQILVEQKTKL